jgi:hypothetical protein
MINGLLILIKLLKLFKHIVILMINKDVLNYLIKFNII